VDCARRAGVTVTGSFDDACGCQLGGLVMTDNRKDEILLRQNVPDLDVLIYCPEKKIRKKGLPLEKLHALANKMENVISLMPQDPWNAMTCNGRMISSASNVDNSMAEAALEAGALGAGMSGSGPAVAMVFRKGEAETFMSSCDTDMMILTHTRGTHV